MTHTESSHITDRLLTIASKLLAVDEYVTVRTLNARTAIYERLPTNLAEQFL